MRPWLRWTLFVSLVSSAFALWWPDTVTRAVVRTEAAMVTSENADPVSQQGREATGSVVSARLPSQLSSVALQSASFDPFVGLQPPPPTPAPVPMPVVTPPPPAPLPAAPPLAYRYLGQMVDPSGKRYVYLGKADKELAVAVGTRLEDGYIVESIGPEGIRLHYPPLDVHSVIPLPQETDSNQR